ncbi:hypothetical protein SDC9_87891 [bioreactor metagenome]|uniref:Uncharacterized protein n=1 Tax=bioreactor metagenome TaxID=1076179 RepID=A0A644ZN43_9ZZZZ
MDVQRSRLRVTGNVFHTGDIQPEPSRRVYPDTDGNRYSSENRQCIAEGAGHRSPDFHYFTADAIGTSTCFNTHPDHQCTECRSHHLVLQQPPHPRIFTRSLDYRHWNLHHVRKSLLERCRPTGQSQGVRGEFQSGLHHHKGPPASCDNHQRP